MKAETKEVEEKPLSSYLESSRGRTVRRWKQKELKKLEQEELKRWKKKTVKN